MNARTLRIGVALVVVSMVALAPGTMAGPLGACADETPLDPSCEEGSWAHVETEDGDCYNTLIDADPLRC